MPRVAVVGNLSLDLVDGGPPRVGGGAYYCGRALAALGADAIVATACAPDDRAALVGPLEQLGVRVWWHEADTTATFGLHYHGDEREMEVERTGPRWTPDDVAQLEPALDGVGWVHVAGLLRSDFPDETLAALADGRRLSLDAQGLVRAPRLGALRQDHGFDDGMLRHVTVLKVSEDEAPAVAGSAEPEAFDALGVPEVLLTLGTQGSIVIAGGRHEHVPALPPFVPDPTGAGDMYSAGYLAARAAGHPPVEAAREATALVARLLAS